MPVHPVIESKGMSAVIKAKVCECNQCGFQWIPQTKELPERCPSRECRSIGWNDSKRAKRKYERKPKQPGRPKGRSKKKRG